MALLQSLPLKGLFFVHLVLISWAIHGNWLPYAYIFYNSFFLFMLLWAIHHKDSEEPVFMSMVLNAMSVSMDILVISVSATYYYLSPYQKFTLAIMNERGDEYNNFSVPNFKNYFGVGGQSGDRGPYENIGQSAPQSVPHNDVEPSDTFVRFPEHGSVT